MQAPSTTMRAFNQAVEQVQNGDATATAKAKDLIKTLPPTERSQARTRLATAQANAQSRIQSLARPKPWCASLVSYARVQALISDILVGAGPDFLEAVRVLDREAATRRPVHITLTSYCTCFSTNRPSNAVASAPNTGQPAPGRPSSNPPYSLSG